MARISPLLSIGKQFATPTKANPLRGGDAKPGISGPRDRPVAEVKSDGPTPIEQREKHWVAVGKGCHLESPMTALSYLYLPSDPMIPLVCSARLTMDHRLDFRRDVLNALESASAGGETVVSLDLSAVVEVDASGLGVLILLQKRARERGLRTRLLSVPSFMEKLFDDTRMGPLFDIVRSA